MALEHLVLGLVAGGTRHGYAIWRHVDGALGGRGTVQRSHVYGALAALERRGLIVAIAVHPPGRRGRRAFDATPTGRARLRAWLEVGPSGGTLVVQRALFVKLAVRAVLGERPSRREVAAEHAARRAVEEGGGAAPSGLVRLLHDRAQRHAEAERWLLDQLEVVPSPATRSRPGSRSR